MEDTLLIGDHVFVNREQFAAPRAGWDRCCPIATFAAGDIVVFLSPEEHGLFVVKRIIGIPGDRIHLARRRRLSQRREARRALRRSTKAIHYDPVDRDAFRMNFPAVMPRPDDQLTDDLASLLSAYIQGGDIVVPPTVISPWATTAT